MANLTSAFRPAFFVTIKPSLPVHWSKRRRKESPDLTRIPYGAEISLRQLSPGSYVLRLTATDNITKASATQLVKFVVE